jgi:DNA-binding transcriptional LysR family regulator
MLNRSIETLYDGRVELHHLRYLVAVADERHFGRAATTLFISQPSLSYAIKSLEREMGVRLLHRGARGVELTPAGAEVVAQARRALRAADRVRAVAEDHRLGRAGRLRIGFEVTGAGELGTRARQRFAERYPRVRVELARFDWGAEADALRRGEVDLAYIWLPCDDRDLDLEVIATEARYVGVSRRHRLAGRDSLSIDDLAGEPLMSTPLAPRFWVDWWAVNPRPDGSPVVWGPHSNNVEECFEQVADGAAACICPTSMVAFYRRPDLSWIPITDIDPLRIALGRRRDSDDPLVRAFTEVVHEIVADDHVAGLPHAATAPADVEATSAWSRIAPGRSAR